MINTEKLCHLGLSVIEIEAEAIRALASSINDDFVKACEYMLQCEGRIIVLGMGKSGHIGRKVAATLASTGTAAFFVHPAEASHGDLGMIASNDVILVLSNSGETEEILTILPMIKHLAIPLICLTGDANSTLAKAATVHLNVRIEREACPLGLAPTSSTTAMLVMGDALAAALLDARGFTKDDFARSHPKGLLGKRLLLYIDDLMHTSDHIPKISINATISQALIEMTQKGLGMTIVIDEQGYLTGIYTDGDLRRTLDKGYDLHTTKISHVMTTNSKTIKPGMLAFDALQIMETFKITSLVVTHDNKHIEGIIHIHDLFRAGVK
jgi:arabinose-5-phosphate isomerase